MAAVNDRHNFTNKLVDKVILDSFTVKLWAVSIQENGFIQLGIYILFPL